MLMKANRNQYLEESVGIKFEIPYYTLSGLSVRYMKIFDESGYEATPWVRYITQSQEYSIII